MKYFMEGMIGLWAIIGACIGGYISYGDSRVAVTGRKIVNRIKNLIKRSK